MVLLVLSVLLLITTVVDSRCLGINEIKVCNNDLSKCFCRQCTRCPPGYGLNIDCWGMIYQGTVMKCVPCIQGESYSSENSSARCQPCPQCDGKKMLHRCTPKNETECSPNECEKGFKLNPLVDSCEPIKVPITPQPSTILLTTTQSTTTQGTQPSTAGPNQITTGPQVSHDDQKTTRTNPKDITTSPDHPNPDHLKTIKQLVIAIIAIILVAALAAGVYYFRENIRKYCHKCASTEDGKTEECVPLNEVSGSQNSSPTLPRLVWPDGLLLTDIPDNDLSCPIKTKITRCSNTVKGWRAIGKELELDDITLDNIDNHRDEEKGEQLFVALKSHQPKLTLIKFVDVLVKLKRNDVVKLVNDYYTKNNTATRESQQSINHEQ